VRAQRGRRTRPVEGRAEAGQSGAAARWRPNDCAAKGDSVVNRADRPSRELLIIALMPPSHRRGVRFAAVYSFSRRLPIMEKCAELRVAAVRSHRQLPQMLPAPALQRERAARQQEEPAAPPLLSPADAAVLIKCTSRLGFIRALLSVIGH